MMGFADIDEGRDNWLLLDYSISKWLIKLGV